MSDVPRITITPREVDAREFAAIASLVQLGRTPEAWVRFQAACLGDGAIARLGGCASTQVPPPEPLVEVREMRTPIPVPCVSVHEMPPMPRTAFVPDGDIKQNAASAAIDIERLQDYAVIADALLRQCAKP